MNKTPVDIFISYAHEDERLLKRLKLHLAHLHGQGLITLWHDRDITAGTEWATEIDTHLNTAQIILLLVSPAFTASSYCTSIELQRALDRHEAHEARVIPIILRPVPWEEARFGKLQALPTGARPVTGRTWRNVDEALATVTEGIRKVVEELRSQNDDAGQDTQRGSLQPPGQLALPNALAKSLPHTVSLPSKPATSAAQRGIFRIKAWLLIGLAVLVVLGGVLASMGLLARFSTNRAGNSLTPLLTVQGGTWTDDEVDQPDSLIPNGSAQAVAWEIDQALYLPLFYGDAQGVFHAGAANTVPTVQNGGVSADATIWTFHLRPHLVWSDGQPYDARDVDYSWRLWLNPVFGAATTFELIRSADVSPDHLSITFHLKHPSVSFLQFWVDGEFAPLPAHHFSTMAPGQILKSPENLNPKVTSGPFLMSESKPGNHYTVVRNPRYYQANERLPYLDKVVFRIVTHDTISKDLQAGVIDSTLWLDVTKVQEYQHLHGYTLVTASSSAFFEALYFNFHNVVLASHQEVREAIARAIDYQSLIASIPQGLATQLCTDHGTFYHPGFEPGAPCPIFDPEAANQLLDTHGWVRGPDGVRTKDNQRLEFDYATNTQGILTAWRFAGEAILKRNLQAIGIQLDIQNYPGLPFFSLLAKGEASPPTGAVAGRYDIAELANSLGYDPDDSSFLSCAYGPNIEFYCNPALETLYQQELGALDAGQRQQIFNQIHAIYLTDFPFVTLYSPPIIYIVHKGTHNYQPSPLGFEDPNIWEWWCDRGTC